MLRGTVFTESPIWVMRMILAFWKSLTSTIFLTITNNGMNNSRVASSKHCSRREARVVKTWVTLLNSSMLIATQTIASPGQERRESVRDSTQAPAIRASQGKINVIGIASSALLLKVFQIRTFFNFSKTISSKNHQRDLKRMHAVLLTSWCSLLLIKNQLLRAYSMLSLHLRINWSRMRTQRGLWSAFPST